ncbi:MAG: phospho-N-acetylmuramoyl-pentapeptide-transferase [Elusimicrobia bacterium]|nr:phospho-N-acetylmuramoyl-pentapeptide-transferase [Elusimicrobiota bacterium]
MLYHLAQLRDVYFGFNVFAYITFRAGAAAVTAFALSLLLGPMVIRRLIKAGLVNKPKVWGPESHQGKTGVAVGGGFLIIGVMLATIFLWARPDNRFVLIALALLVIFGALGFWDDWVKIRGPRVEGKAEGISSRIKFILQVGFAAFFAFYLALYPPNHEFALHVNVPFIKETYLNLHVFYFVLVMLLFVGFANSVNLTDGMDGLAIGNLIIAATAMLVFVYVAGHVRFSQYLRIISVAEAGELTIVLSALVGAGLGFLWFNCYPAQVFMGDTGSLPLGALLVYVSIVAKQELLLPLIGGVFIAEAASVIMQITYFKLSRGKRIFRMSPFHHHFELTGVAEPKVVVRFWVAGIILALLALSSLKVR